MYRTSKLSRSNLFGKLIRRCILAAMLVCWTKGMPAAPVRNAPVPTYTVDLAALGYRLPSARALASGESLETVDFADATHLLITYNQRKLIPRLRDDAEGDRDRIVRVLLVSVTDGKLVAETEWRTHDHARYLWQLTGGKFLVRLGNSLSLLTPTEAHGGEELVRRSLLTTERRLRAVQVSPDGRSVAVQTSAQELVGDDPDEPKQKRPVELDFFNFRSEPPALVKRGATSVSRLLHLSFNEQGYLVAKPEKGGTWGFDLEGFRGEHLELAGVQSSCRPDVLFVDATEFIANGCRAGDERGMLGGFNLRGEILWVQGVTPPHSPGFAFAADAGRFALRITNVEVDALAPEGSGPMAQEVRVYQTYNGVELLRVGSTPVHRAEQNFALSADGHELVVWRNETLAVYSLPPLTAKDTKAVEAASKPVTLPASTQ